MPQHKGQVPIELRCAIITCRLLYHESYENIERKTGVRQPTASRIYNRARASAGNEELMDLLAYVHDRDRSGRPRLAEGEGSRSTQRKRRREERLARAKATREKGKENRLQEPTEQAKKDEDHAPSNNSPVDENVGSKSREIEEAA